MGAAHPAPRSDRRWRYGPTACRAPAASQSIAPTSKRQTPNIPHHVRSLSGSDAFTGSRVAGENVGTYTIQEGSLGLPANYNLTFLSSTLSARWFFNHVTFTGPEAKELDTQ